MSNKVEIEYFNYNPKIHLDFPVITSCKVYSKNNILNLYIEGNRFFDQIIDDIGYDGNGRHLLVSIGQWHHIESGVSISNETFYDLSDEESYNFEYVSVNIKIYTKEDYRSCFHNDLDRRAVISFIPYKMIKFTENEANEKIFTYKVI